MSHLEERGEGGERRELPLVLDLALTALITVAVVVLVRMFVLDGYLIPTGSMLDTIKLDNIVLGEKVSYRFRAPAAGEIVTFDDPADASVTLIKRVIATEGQTVDLQEGHVLVDGAQLDEPYVEGKPTERLERWSPTLSGPIVFPFTVPDGMVWVMGDNRTNSLDSRYFGPVPTSSVHAHALCVFWPLSDFKAL